MQEYQTLFERCAPIDPLTILTGKGFSKNQPILRPAVAKMLSSEFSPSLDFKFEDGGITISKETIVQWIRSQDEQDKQERTLLFLFSFFYAQAVREKHLFFSLRTGKRI